MATLNEIIADIDEQIERAERASSENRTVPVEQIQQEQLQKFVLVQIGTERIAIPINGLAEIGPTPTITRLPNLPDWIVGISNFRGEIISVLDLQKFLLPDSSHQSLGDRMAILYSNEMKLGICVSQILGTIMRPESDLTDVGTSVFQQAAPEVFSSGLFVEDMPYQALIPESLLNMDRLINYYAVK